MSKHKKIHKRRPIIFLASSVEAKDIMNNIASYVEEAGGESKRWPDAFQAGEFVLESLLNASQEVDGALIVATPDDKGVIRKKTYWIPRDNVIVELGIFLSSLTRQRAGLIYVSGEKGKIQLPSDLSGLVHIPFKKSTPVKNEKAITDWMNQFFIEKTHQQSPLPTPKGGRYTWGDVIRGLEHIQLTMEYDNYIPDIILGLGRSGGVVGGILASFLDSMPLSLLDIKYSKSKPMLQVEFKDAHFNLPKNTKRVLVIEGATTGGATLVKVHELLTKCFPHVKFRFAVLIQSITSCYACDYYAFLETGVISPLPWHGPRSKTFLTPSKP